MARRGSNDALSERGFITPMPVGSEPGDAFDAPPASAPGGPVPDPISNLPRAGRTWTPGRSKELPDK